MNSTAKTLIAGAALASLAGCAIMPPGPSMPAHVGSSRSLDQYSADDAACRNYATAQIGGTPQQYADNSAVQSAAMGTLIGAAIGAAAGGGSGAAIGAGAGLAMGALAGTDQSYRSGAYAQRGYDSAYFQCMYSKGNSVPAWAVPRQARQANVMSAPQYAPAPPEPRPRSYYPPPPPPPPDE